MKTISQKGWKFRVSVSCPMFEIFVTQIFQQVSCASVGLFCDSTFRLVSNIKFGNQLTDSLTTTFCRGPEYLKPHLCPAVMIIHEMKVIPLRGFRLKFLMSVLRLVILRTARLAEKHIITSTQRLSEGENTHFTIKSIWLYFMLCCKLHDWVGAKCEAEI